MHICNAMRPLVGFEGYGFRVIKSSFFEKDDSEHVIRIPIIRSHFDRTPGEFFGFDPALALHFFSRAIELLLHVLRGEVFVHGYSGRQPLGRRPRRTQLDHYQLGLRHHIHILSRAVVSLILHNDRVLSGRKKSKTKPPIEVCVLLIDGDRRTQELDPREAYRPAIAGDANLTFNADELCEQGHHQKACKHAAIVRSARFGEQIQIRYHVTGTVRNCTGEIGAVLSLFGGCLVA